MVRSLDQILAAREQPAREEILSPWLESGTLNMVYAPSGKGKTFVALSLSIAVATGGEFLGWKAEKPRSVLYIDGEMGAEKMALRLEGILNANEQELKRRPDLSNFHFIVEDEFEERMVPDMSEPANFPYYSARMEDKDFIVIDNLQCCSEIQGPQDNDYRRWRRMRNLLQPLRNDGKTILLVHHANKSGQQEGFADKTRAMDVILAIKECNYNVDTVAENYFELHFEKGRELKKSERQPLFVEQIYTEVKADGTISPNSTTLSPVRYPLLTWRHQPLTEVHKKICNNIRARSTYPKATYKELAYMLGVSYQEAQEVWAQCDADIAARKKANNKTKTPSGEISLDGIDV